MKLKITPEHYAVNTQLCRGCGKCAEVCPSGAALIEDFPVVDQDKCIFCSTCELSCMTDAMRVNSTNSKMAGPDPEACVCCGVCVEQCPMEAITTVPKARIMGCSSCGACASICPEHAIERVIPDVDNGKLMKAFSTFKEEQTPKNFNAFVQELCHAEMLTMVQTTETDGEKEMVPAVYEHVPDEENAYAETYNNVILYPQKERLPEELLHGHVDGVLAAKVRVSEVIRLLVMHNASCEDPFAGFIALNAVFDNGGFHIEPSDLPSFLECVETGKEYRYTTELEQALNDFQNAQTSEHLNQVLEAAKNETIYFMLGKDEKGKVGPYRFAVKENQYAMAVFTCRTLMPLEDQNRALQMSFKEAAEEALHDSKEHPEFYGIVIDPDSYNTVLTPDALRKIVEE